MKRREFLKTAIVAAAGSAINTAIPDYSFGDIIHNTPKLKQTYSFLTINAWGIPFATEFGKRKEQLFLGIKELDPDFIVFQELWYAGYVNECRERFPDYELHYSGGLLRNKSGLALLSRYPIQNPEIDFFEKKDDYSIGETLASKGFLSVDVNLQVPLRIIGTHLHEYADKAAGQLEYLLKSMHEKSKGVTVMLGDFNMWPEKLADYIKGFFIIEGEKTYSTENIFVKEKESRKLDYIIAKGSGGCSFNVLNKKVVFKEKPVSDHYGVYAELEFLCGN